LKKKPTCNRLGKPPRNRLHKNYYFFSLSHFVLSLSLYQFFSFTHSQGDRKDWKGLCVTVKLTIQNLQAKVFIVPSAVALVIKALKELKRDRKKTKNIKHNGNISLDDVIKIAKVMRHKSMAKDLSGTVKEILGMCVSVGCTVDGKDPKDLQQEIIDGDVEIPLD
ncbi:60S ribosomal protein L12-like, partial [Juglans microcarpa x Juglans regia]|uniref:60S ribosomal protein L12-like n=1 Tax=Juglans microcarpa x Juglans regia TaxID=2249226 RepID=UPI001B7E25F3